MPLKDRDVEYVWEWGQLTLDKTKIRTRSEDIFKDEQLERKSKNCYAWE